MDIGLKFKICYICTLLSINLQVKTTKKVRIYVILEQVKFLEFLLNTLKKELLHSVEVIIKR